MRFYIKNFGCRLNRCEGDIIAEKLIFAGHNLTNWKYADFIIVNGCTVTGRADQKVRQFIHRTCRENPNAKILLTGCTANAINRGFLDKIDEAIIVPLKMRYGIHKIIENDFEIKPANSDSTDVFVTIDGAGISRTRAQLKIQDGCDKRCAYCIVPLIRGKSRCRKTDDIISQAKILVKRKFREIILTGVDIGDWRDGEMKLVDSIKSILSQTDVYRIRLSSIEPPGLTDELLDLIAAEPRIAAHLHIPFQSGSRRLLADMNRPAYSVDDLLEKLIRLRKNRPEICFGTDIIFGYPTETDNDFAKTVRLLKSKILNYAHIFKFSPRPATKAFELKQIPSKILNERAKLLRVIDSANRTEFAQKFIGENLDFIVERKNGDIITGHTGNYLKVRAKGFGKRGEIAYIKVDGAGEMSVSGKIEN